MVEVIAKAEAGGNLEELEDSVIPEEVHVTEMNRGQNEVLQVSLLQEASRDNAMAT
jgi:hypothetical protein